MSGILTRTAVHWPGCKQESSQTCAWLQGSRPSFGHQDSQEHLQLAADPNDPNAAPSINLSNRLNPNNIHFDRSMAEHYKALSKTDKEVLWARHAPADPAGLAVRVRCLPGGCATMCIACSGEDCPARQGPATPPRACLTSASRVWWSWGLWAVRCWGAAHGPAQRTAQLEPSEHAMHHPRCLD